MCQLALANTYIENEMPVAFKPKRCSWRSGAQQACLSCSIEGTYTSKVSIGTTRDSPASAEDVHKRPCTAILREDEKSRAEMVVLPFLSQKKTWYQYPLRSRSTCKDTYTLVQPVARERPITASRAQWSATYEPKTVKRDQRLGTATPGHQHLE
jgi:hypothetical protein